MFTRSARFLAVLSFAIGFCPRGAHAQDPSASDLLKKIDETYRQISSYSVVAERKVDLDTDPGGQGYGEPNVVHTGSHESHDIQVTMMVSPSSKMKLLLKEGKKEIVVVCDGKVVWTFLPAQRTYTEAMASSASVQTPVYVLRIGNNEISGEGLLSEYETLIATRFRSVANSESWAKLERPETLKVGKDRKECYVLTIQMPGGVQKQKLWVDKTDFSVWKSVDTTLSPWNYRGGTLKTTVTMTTEQMALNPSLDDSNFVFTPPGQAKKVDSLMVSGSNPF